ncbi:hypothetical protein D9M69_375300 [compost metagenome]
MGFQQLLVLQGVLHQRRQRVVRPLRGLLAQALVQADDFLHQGGEEASGQHPLLGQQGLQVQAELVALVAQLREFALVGLQVEQRRVDAVQRVFLVVPLVDGGDHLVGRLGFLVEVVQVVLHRVEEVQDRLVDAEGGPAAVEVVAQRVELRVELFGAHRGAEQFALALEQALVGLQVEQALVVLAVVVLGLGGQFEQQLAVVLLVVGQQPLLLADLLQAQVEHVLAVLHQGQYLVDHALLEQAFLLRDDALAEQVFQVLQLAALQQRGVVAHLGQQRLLGRQRQHFLRRQAELPGGGALHLGDGVLHEGIAGQVVPQHVDLVEHGEQAGLGVLVELADVVAPDFHVAGGHPGVGGEQEDDRLGVGQHRQGQLRLAAEGVEAGGVEDAQALAQQRMVEVDQRVAPGRHQHQAGLAGAFQGVRVEAELDRLFDRHRLGLRHLGEGLDHVGRVAEVQGDVHPVPGNALELRDAGLGQARLDRQQADVGAFRARVEEQFGGAHGGAPGLRGQHALAVGGEEQAVDQLGLAARELADEGQGDVVGAQQAQGGVQARLDALGAQSVLHQPAAIAGDLAHQLAFPGHVGPDLLTETFHAHPDSPLDSRPAGRGKGNCVA